MGKAKIGSDTTSIKETNSVGTGQMIEAGGKPSTGTPKDKRLKENKTVITH